MNMCAHWPVREISSRDLGEYESFGKDAQLKDCQFDLTPCGRMEQYREPAITWTPISCHPSNYLTCLWGCRVTQVVGSKTRSSLCGVPQPLVITLPPKLHIGFERRCSGCSSVLY